LIEPVPGSPAALTPVQALAHMKTFDVSSRLTSVVLRGLNLCVAAAQDGHFRGRIWAYLTDIPQQRELLDDASRAKIELIVSASQYILCQTPQMERYFVSMFPTARQITRLLPPMIPPIDRAPRSRPDRTFRWCYAGKFAPQWGILDMFGAFDTLNRRGIDSELHIFGDKIHRSADHPDFHETVSRKLVSTDGLVWHGAVGRDELLRGLGAMQACWAFRDPNFERTTLELSTKALEYAALGVPTILARSPVFESVFGVDYQLFADSAAQAVDLLTRLASDEKFCVQVSESLIESANGYTFEVVRAKLQAQQMFN
jgi:glycosyltransferase involved in cell wall biosynthesis